MEELYNKIENYLAGTLSAPDSKAFEQALQQDPELAAEVNLHRQLQKTFSDPKEIALRQSLTEITHDFTGEPATPGAKKPFYQSIWFYIGLIAALLLLYLVSRNPNPKTIQPDETFDQDSLIQEEPEDSTTLSGIESIEAPIPQESKEEGQISAPTIPVDPPAVTQNLFASNPVLETLLDPESWSFRYDFDLNANVVELDQGSNIVIDGELVAPELDKEQFTIVIFNNQSQNYPSSPMLRQVLTPRETEDEGAIAFGGKQKYAILLDEIIEDLAPGLYYYQVYMESEPEPLCTGSFRKEP